MKTIRTTGVLAAFALALALPACAPEGANGTADEADGEMAEVQGRLADDTRDVDEMAEQVGDTHLTVVEAEPYGVYLATDDAPLYVFTADTKNEASACRDACAEAWPPVTGKIDIGPPLDMALVGTIEREDGTLQTTYGGWPLYTFSRDQEASEPTGQEMESFGGEWYLVGLRGSRIDGDAADGSEANADAS